MITPSFSITATERVLPRLALDFTTANLDSRVTFTRLGNTATVVNSSGVLTLVNADAPRFDFTLNTGGVCKGLLIEEARTNLAFNSSNVLTTNWLQSIYNSGAINYYTVTNGPTNSIGPSNANYFVATATPGTIAARQTLLSLTSGTTYTVSAYIYVPSQAGVTNWRMDNNYSGDYSTGTSQTQFNTWVRVTNTITLTGIRTIVDFNVLMNNGSTPTVGFNFYATNFQVEAGSFATSYIPTTTTALTRNADVAKMTGTNFSDWYNASAGSMYFEGVLPAVRAASSYSYGLSIINNTDLNNRTNIGIYSNGSLLGAAIVSRASGSVDVNIFDSVVSANTSIKQVVRLKSNDVLLYRNATLVGSDVTCTMPTVNNMYIGTLDGVSASNIFNGWIAKIMYWPQSLTASEIQAFSK